MNKEILRLAIPSIFANITVPFVGIVDVAIAGHISNASAIGGIAVGSMIFDLLYWNFGFLRVGTGGMTAQAYGRKDFQSVMDIFSQSITISMGAALFILLIGWIFTDLVLYCVPCSSEVEMFARDYFSVRIWAAPATLSLMAFKGWFIGCQNTVSPMICDIVVNVVNMLASFCLAVYTPLGALGVAYGTVIAQYVGMLTAILLVYTGYRKYFKYFNLGASVAWPKLKKLVALNGNLFLRSIGFMVVYVGFTVLCSKYGDEALAVGTIMMKLFMIFSYLIDGFAYAGEALIGRFIGEQSREKVNSAVKYLFYWCLSVGIVFTVIYIISGEGMVRMMTSDEEVIANSRPFHIWLVAMPLLSCAAFIWDGIYVGATAGRQVRNCMMFSALGFVLAYACCAPKIGIQAVYVAYFVHLIVRAVYLSARWRRVLDRCIPICCAFMLLFIPSQLKAQVDVLDYQPVDSSYLAEVEAIMEEIDNEQQQELYEKEAIKTIRYEQSFHTEGVNLLLRGLLSVTKDRHFREDMPAPLKSYDCDVSDYAATLAPMGVTWGLKALGVESRSKTRRMVISNAMAMGLTYATVRGLKSAIDESRPNATDMRSMPSGHAAIAFASATILHREYGYISPFVSVGGYTCATASQYLRLRHNEHWLTDMYVGAGLGVILTNVAYYLTDRMLGKDGINRPRISKHDINRTAEFLYSPSRFSLMAGPEYGSESKLRTSTMFSAGLSYRHSFLNNLGFEVMGRLSTASCFKDDSAICGTIDTYHLNGGVVWSVPVAETMRVGAHLYGGARLLDIPYVNVINEIKPEVGAGLIIDMLQNERYSVGVGCDYIHTFSDWFRGRWNINMTWNIFL